MGQINNTPNFKAMGTQLIANLQSDAEIKGMDFIHSNFEQQAWHGQSLEPWEPRKHSSSYNLLRVTNYLFNSINVAQSNSNKVVFEADAPYAKIHNEGGTLNIPITKKARKYFWAMYYATNNSKWKAMALTTKTRFSVKIDKRQFMGDSAVFKSQWHKHVTQQIIQHFNTL